MTANFNQALKCDILSTFLSSDVGLQFAVKKKNVEKEKEVVKKYAIWNTALVSSDTAHFSSYFGCCFFHADAKDIKLKGLC